MFENPVESLQFATNQWLGVAVTCVFAHGWHNGTHLCQIGFATAHVQCE